MPVYFGTDTTRYKLCTSAGAVVPHLFEGQYVIEDGKLLWANPNLKLIKQAGTSTNIDTGHTATVNTVMEGVFGFDEELEIAASNRHTIWSNGGTYLQTNCFSYTFWHNSNAGYASWIWFGNSGGAQVYNLNMVAGHRYKVVMSGTLGDNSFLEDLTTGTVLSQTTDTKNFAGGTRTSTLFSSETRQQSNYHIYHVKIYESDTLLHHFVPVPSGLHIGDYVVPANGMWDIVTQQFFGPISGSGTFLFGSDEGDVDYIVTGGGQLVYSHPRNYLGFAGSYQQYDWTIVPSGVYLDEIGGIEVQSQAYESEIAFLVGYTLPGVDLCMGNYAFLGYLSRESRNVVASVLYFLGSIVDKNERGMTDEELETYKALIDTQGGLYYKATLLEDGDIQFKGNFSEQTITPTQEPVHTEILLGSTYNSHYPDRGTQGYTQMRSARWYKFWDKQGKLIRHFVPVPQGMKIGSFTIPSNGLFDIVNQQFYGNQGTGTFSFNQDNFGKE